MPCTNYEIASTFAKVMHKKLWLHSFRIRCKLRQILNSSKSYSVAIQPQCLIETIIGRPTAKLCMII